MLSNSNQIAAVKPITGLNYGHLWRNPCLHVCDITHTHGGIGCDMIAHLHDKVAQVWHEHTCEVNAKHVSLLARMLKGLVVSPMDKNGGMAHLACMSVYGSFSLGANEAAASMRL